MTIESIEFIKETENFVFVEIEFKKQYFKPFKKICVTRRKSCSVDFCDTGHVIPSQLWEITKAFIETGDRKHNYKLNEIYT